MPLPRRGLFDQRWRVWCKWLFADLLQKPFHLVQQVFRPSLRRPYQEKSIQEVPWAPCQLGVRYLQALLLLAQQPGGPLSER